MTASQIPSRRLRRAGLLGLTVGLGWWLGNNLERLLNRVPRAELPAVSPAARRLHRNALVIDLHCDSLLLDRDLLQRSSYGHVDLPRLQAGNVAVQVFAAATRIPIGFNVNRTPARPPDLLTAAGLLRRSRQAWRSPFQRALHHAGHLHRLAERSHGQLAVVHDRAKLDALLAARAKRPFLVGGILGIEGTQALDGDPENLIPLHAAGYRILGLTHFIDTPFAGSAHGWRQGGLTAAGRELLAYMAELEMILDVAHLSAQALDEVLNVWQGPLLMSHGGVRATCNTARNLGDDQVRAIAATGGVIGIGYWETAVGGRHPRHIVAAIKHVIQLVGDDHVALGSDFDGGIRPGFDTSQLDVLTQQMLSAGFPETTVRKVLGENAQRLLRAGLPQANA